MAGLCVRLAALLCCAALPGGGAAQRQAAFSLDHTHMALEISESVDSSQDYEVYSIPHLRIPQLQCHEIPLFLVNPTGLIKNFLEEKI